MFSSRQLRNPGTHAVRFELLYNPRLLCERLAIASQRCGRLAKLWHTVASHLTLGHIDSLELLELLRDKPPKVIYDIGANVGTWTLLAKVIFSEAQVHAFEPLAKHVAGFKNIKGSVGSIHLHPVALGNTKATQVMQVASFSDASSLVEMGSRMAEDFKVNKAGEETVAVERLDDYAAANGLPAPDLLKLDVQGYELEVFRGAERCLHRARAVISEVSFVEFYPKQCRFEDVVTFLAEHGFRVHAFAFGTVLGKPVSQTDVLFLRCE